MIEPISGLASDLGAAVAEPTDADPAIPPVVLVHGIHDNLRRFLHPLDGLSDRDFAIPAFDPDVPPRPVSPREARKVRLLEALHDRGLRALAYSYQRPGLRSSAILPLDDAVRGLDSMIERARSRFDSDDVTIAGHSRGGLVARACLARPGVARKVAKLVTLATPHEGSAVATLGEEAIARGLAMAERAASAVRLDFVAAIATLFRSYRALAPRGEEIERLRAEGFPILRAGIAAAAGDVSAFVRYALPFGSGAFPGDLAARFPALSVPEFRDGEGDMLVSVASALAVPEGSRTRVFGANHLTLCHRTEPIEFVAEEARAARAV